MIDKNTINRITGYAETAYPNECAGYLLDFGCTSDLNLEKGKKYSLPPFMGAVGVYHSHPGDSCEPSRYDKQKAIDGFYYLIVSVIDGKACGHKLWLFTDGRFEAI